MMNLLPPSSGQKRP